MKVIPLDEFQRHYDEGIKVEGCIVRTPHLLPTIDQKVEYRLVESEIMTGMYDFVRNH